MSSLDYLLQTSGVLVRHGELPPNGVRRVFVHAGQVWVAQEVTEMTTVLGSCVAICIWDEMSGIGGMNHFMLPHDIGANFATPRYANYATTLLLRQLRDAGADIRHLRAKIYGGAHILGASSNAHRDLGALNVAAAHERMHAERIRVVEEETGGAHGRKVVYHSATGTTIVTQVNRVV